MSRKCEARCPILTFTVGFVSPCLSVGFFRSQKPTLNSTLFVSACIAQGNGPPGPKGMALTWPKEGAPPEPGDPPGPKGVAEHSPDYGGSLGPRLGGTLGPKRAARGSSTSMKA